MLQYFLSFAGVRLNLLSFYLFLDFANIKNRGCERPCSQRVAARQSVSSVSIFDLFVTRLRTLIVKRTEIFMSRLCLPKAVLNWDRVRQIVFSKTPCSRRGCWFSYQI